MITVQDFTKIEHDMYGNPRYYLPAYMLPTMSDALRLRAGLCKYRGKRYGAGYVVQSYNLASTVDHIKSVLAS